MSKIEYKDLIAFHPGYYVKEWIDDQDITQEELSKRLRTTPKYVSDLVNGRINLTDDMILKLSLVCNTSTTLWFNLNNRYKEKIIEIEEKKMMDNECELVKQIDYKYWVNLGLVKPTKNSAEKVQELLRYLKISSLNVLKQNDFLVQYKTSIADVQDINIINANGWVQTAINLGMQIETEPFNKKMLENAIPEIRSMTLLPASQFQPRLNELMAKCGIALVFLPNLKNCGINGAVKWLNKNKVILALNDRKKDNDIFWFALFHELGHVLQQRLTLLIVSDNTCKFEGNELLQKLETDADSFAQNTLIKQDDYIRFLSQSNANYTKENIQSFAESINIHPGIVVGRLQKEKRIPYKSSLNHLKTKYTIR